MSLLPAKSNGTMFLPSIMVFGPLMDSHDTVRIIKYLTLARTVATR